MEADRKIAARLFFLMGEKGRGFWKGAVQAGDFSEINFDLDC